MAPQRLRDGAADIHPTAALAPGVTVGRGARIGAYAQVTAGMRIGAEAHVRPHAVVVADVPALAVVAGDPAAVISYSHNTCVSGISADAPPYGTADWVRRLPQVNQARGSLTHAEVGADLPFVVRRAMVVRDVPHGGHRGDHGHRTLQELLICVAGSCKVLLDDGLGRREVVELTDPSTAVYVAPRVWTAQYAHSPDAILMVLASAEYEPEDYIDDYDDFVSHARSAGAVRGSVAFTDNRAVPPRHPKWQRAAEPHTA